MMGDFQGHITDVTGEGKRLLQTSLESKMCHSMIM